MRQIARHLAAPPHTAPLARTAVMAALTAVVLLLITLAPGSPIPHNDPGLDAPPHQTPTQTLVSLPPPTGTPCEERRSQHDPRSGPDDHNALIPSALDPESARRLARLSLRTSTPRPVRPAPASRPRAPPA